MPITVPAGSTTQVKKVVTEPNVKVAKVVIGRPVKRVTSGSFAISNLYDVDVSSLENGSLLIYNTSTSKWIASKNVEDGQNINGGSY